MQNILKKIFGSQNSRMIKKLWPIVNAINAMEPALQKLTDEELSKKTEEFRARLKKGETLDQILPEAFAVVRETSRRITGMRHFDVQLLGGMVLHQGKISEMSTGEGKTLVGTLPVYLNALEGKGVHVVTVNDYLARRDREWMGPIYERLGLTVGVIQHDIEHDVRAAAYRCDITFGTNNEFGFDYLRDNMVSSMEQRVQRPLNYAIVDEVDSILVDEARTPLIISGPSEDSIEKYFRARKAAVRLEGYRMIEDKTNAVWKAEIEKKKQEFDYLVDEKSKTITLTERGEANGAKSMGVDNLHEAGTIGERHQIITALRAKEFFQLDVDYVIKDDEIIIVDEFTGRLMPGRRFSDGLHQALEAKEKVEIRRENQTLATITFQNYFRMYKKLSGMTGTAATEALEFHKIYKLDVVVIPPNRPCVRQDLPDGVFRTEREKFEAVVKEIIREHQTTRPVLVGTISIEKSERLSKMLKAKNLPHAVLNAKYHEQEAEIISRAGQQSGITIATNMAGRGTDILLGEGVSKNGGLYVIGTERHESRRIDNQLRGRCGRQGDPGMSKFFLSLEDDLMRIFGSDRISGVMQKLGMEDGEEIQHPFVTKAIETAQKRVESRNFEIRKHLLEYDDVMNRQRELIYAERDRVLKGEGIREHIWEMTEDVVEDLIGLSMHPDFDEDKKNPDALILALNAKFGGDFTQEVKENTDYVEPLREAILAKIKAALEAKETAFTPARMLYLFNYILLQVIDSKWKDHLYALDNLKEGIGLRAYAQKDPLVEYKREAFSLFEAMVASVKEEVVELIFTVQVVREEKMKSVMDSTPQELNHPSAGGMASFETRGALHSDPALASLDENSPPIPAPVRRDHPKVGRNDFCPCGSGKKYKKCCGTAE
ncbi:MAG: preprotein translocase subunit SecA [Candidatus Omnitrophica bacterium]|nr:preprotein translocase subunit SecA [Candidatus Omnitrophota bacterium]